MIFNSNVKKIFSAVIKVVIIIVSYGFIYKQVFYEKSLDDIYYSFGSLFSSHVFISNIGFVFLLMLVNWGIETWKWNYLLSRIEKLSFFKAFKAVLCGVTVSTFAPNRIGEFFGRIFILEKASPWEGVFVTAIGSMSQLLVTIVTGLISLLFFIPNYLQSLGHLSGYLYDGFVIAVICLIGLFLFIYFNISLLTQLIRKIPYLRSKRLRFYTRIFSIYSFKELLRVLLLSFLRYCVFALQFYILLGLFKISLPFFDAMMIISLNFFIVTAIPTVALSELGVRGYVAIYLLSIYFSQGSGLDEQTKLAIIAASSTLWLINLAIPALIGSIFVFDLKFFNKKNN